MLKICWTTGEVLLLCYCTLSLGVAFPRSPTPVLDQIVLGDTTSEAAHDFYGPARFLAQRILFHYNIHRL